MSVVACKILENGYEMSSDSITVRGFTQSKGSNTNHAKLFEVNDIVIGGCGYAKETNLLRLFSETRSISAPTEYALLEFMGEFLDWKTKKTDEKTLENEYLIGCFGHVFGFNNWYISEIKTYESIGAGMNFALASLYLGHSTEEAVKTAIELSIYCENPIITIRKLKERQ